MARTTARMLLIGPCMIWWGARWGVAPSGGGVNVWQRKRVFVASVCSSSGILLLLLSITMEIARVMTLKLGKVACRASRA